MNWLERVTEWWYGVRFVDAPKPGELWCTGKKDHPFPECDQRSYYRIQDVRDGWVKYHREDATGQVGYTHCDEIKHFIQNTWKIIEPAF